MFLWYTCHAFDIVCLWFSFRGVRKAREATWSERTRWSLTNRISIIMTYLCVFNLCGANILFVFDVGTMDSNTSHEFDSSQQRGDDDPIFSQTSLPHSNFYSFPHPPFHVPPHGFQAMLNSPSFSPNSPFMFRPPHSPMVAQPPNRSSPLGIPNMGSIPNSPRSQPSPNSLNNPPLSSQPKRVRGMRKEPSDEEIVPETQPAPKKPRNSKKKVVVDLGEDDDNDNKKSKWQDFWVDQLIHVRGAWVRSSTILGNKGSTCGQRWPQILPAFTLIR